MPENLGNQKLQPLVSVVTPVYNTDKYLPECIESVLAQTFQNWEYVIVNNCSTDRSLEIARHYAELDARIRVHTNDEFLSQMQNWNHALRQISATSKYCKVVHADDWLFPDCLARMVELAESQPSAGIVGAYRLDEDQVNLDGLPYPSHVVPGRELCRAALLSGLYVFGSPTSLLIRCDLIRARAAFYNTDNIHADQEVCFELLQNCDFGFVHQVLTYTRRHNETTTTFIRRFETYRLGHLTVLKNFGPFYLTPEEYQARLRLTLTAYYKFLARKVLELKDKEFWTYHKSELARLGHPFNTARLMRALLSELLNLKDAVGHFRTARSARRARPPSTSAVKQWDIIGSSKT
jgi:glycosyltransferase involved in cell wall biosynthesis